MAVTLDTAESGRSASSPVSRPCHRLIALVGNPNTGKSALFNRLTGSHQRVGNFPGLTVEKRIGRLRHRAGTIDVLDLPGLYSLDAISSDEWIVHEVLTGRAAGTPRPDLVVCVVDATNLRRNLYLASQVGQTGLPIVIALNMIDEAEAAGIRIDHAELSRRLGVPVVPTAASRGRGTAELSAAVVEALESRPMLAPVDWPAPVREAVAALRDEASRRSLTLCDADAFGLLYGDAAELRRRLGWPVNGEPDPALERLDRADLDGANAESILRYRWINAVLDGILSTAPTRPRKRESIDALLTHRVFGVAVFLAVMYVVFTSIYTLAGPFMDAIEWAFGALGDWAASALATTPMLASLLTDGVIIGVGSVVIFLPQILILFFFIALLEDTGYMARAAFLMDRLFSWCGLSGKSFVPLLSSYACAVPGVMATRTIEDPKARLTTILVAPLMSCSARLPVYVLLIGAFIEPVYGTLWAGFALFAMHLLGLAVAMPIAFVLNRFMLRGRGTPFVLELPPYRVPAMRDVLWRMVERGREFILRAGTIIFAASILIWALCYFPRPDSVEEAATRAKVAAVAAERGVSDDEALALIEGDEELAAALGNAVDAAFLEQSYMGRMGKAAQPIFAPAGFDWKITVGVLASFPAREVLISTLGIIYGLGGDVDEGSSTLVASMRAATWSDGSPVFSVPVAAAVMVFFALCLQCASTVAIITRESGGRWALFAFVYMTALAWAGAVVTYQLGAAWIGA